MADKVCPRDSPSGAGPIRSPAAAKPSPPPGTYVIRLPKDQIFRVPPAENARRYERLSRKKPRRSCCRRLLCCLAASLLLLAVLLAAAAGGAYLLVRPESPEYSGRSVAISGLNLTSPGPISPAIDVAVRASNQNEKIGIYYLENSHVSVGYGDVTLSDGALPSFYQPSNNVTVFVTALRGRLEMSDAMRRGLVDDQERGRVRLRLRIRAPVKLKVGPVTTWRMVVKVKCEVVVDKLMTGAKIVSKDCGYRFYLW